MKEILLDTTRCPGIEVCGNKICLQTFGETFLKTLTNNNGRSLISKSKASDHAVEIDDAIIRCPGQAITIKEYTG